MTTCEAALIHARNAHAQLALAIHVIDRDRPHPRGTAERDDAKAALEATEALIYTLEEIRG